jgi:AcrR family transcriptional regulator
MERAVSESPSRQRLSSQERQDEIVQQAIRLAAETSPERITTQNLADAMGLTQGAVFRHFATKDAIWVAVLDWLGDRLTRVFAEAVAGGSDPLDRIERMLVAHMGFVSRFPGVPRVLFAELQQSADSRLKQLIRGILDGYRLRVIELLQEAKRAGQVAPDLDEAHAAVLYLGMVQGLVMQSLLLPVDLPAQARALFPLYRRALGAVTEVRL